MESGDRHVGDVTEDRVRYDDRTKQITGFDEHWEELGLQLAKCLPGQVLERHNAELKLTHSSS